MLDKKNRRILVIDDNRAIHEDFRKILARRNEVSELEDMEAALFGGGSKKAAGDLYEIDSAFQGEEGLQKVVDSLRQDQRYAVAFVDMRMPPGWDGVQTIEKIWQVDPEIQVVICTAYSDYSWQDILDRFGPTDRLLILKKPFDTAEVCQLACALTEKWHLARHAHLKLTQLRSMVEDQTCQLQSEIRERRRSEEALKVSQARYVLAAKGASDGLWDWNLESGTVYFSDHWKEMLGYAPEEIGSSPEELLSRINPQDRPRVEQRIQAHIAGDSPTLCIEYRVLHRDGQERWMLCRGLAGRDAKGQALRIAGWQSDITDRKLAEEQLRYDAFHDMLTGLGNRTLLIERLERCFEHSRRNSEEKFAVIFLDLDHFKQVNDTYGHLVGDQLLIAVANRLVASTRSADTSARFGGGMHELARLGGDEFVVLLERIHDDSDALIVAKRLEDAFKLPFLIGQQEIHSGASIGLAISDSSHRHGRDILQEADAALYVSKARGRGGYTLFNETMKEDNVDRWDGEQQLRHAIEQKQFSLLFLPVVSLQSNSVVELEALARWLHPEKGEILPADFIPLAEQTGLIVPLGNWVFRTACEAMVQWQRQFPALSGVTVAINISGKQLMYPSLVEDFRRIIEETGVSPQLLRLEMCENAIIEGLPHSLAIVQRLRTLNVRLHLDDFGTGYSPLAYLRKVPLDALKVDRSFISTMRSDSTSISIVQAAVALAHSLGVRVIGEGVETEDELEMLRELGCDAAQGFHLSHPVRPEDVIPFVLSRTGCVSQL